MKKLMLGLMMAFAVTAEAEVISDVQIGDLKYSLDTEAKTATITGYTGSPMSVDVAEVEYLEQKYTVTSVGANAFLRCGSLTSVSLPNVTTIGGDAFNRCSSLTSVSLPNVTTIGGQGAFFLCGSLTSVSLPNATTIGWNAFGACDLLDSVSLPNATTIEVSAFGSCSSLTSVSLPNATTIGEQAFASCHSLTSVSLPNATTIGKDVFREDDQLKTIYVNETMAVRLRRDRGFYYVGDDCEIFPSTVVVEPHPAEHSMVKVYTNGIEEEGDPFFVLSNATVDVVFTADYGYCFKDYTTVQTNAVTATDDPTVVVGPVAIRNTVVVEPHPAEHTTLAKVYTNGVEVTNDPIEVLSNAMVSVVFTAAGGYCFADHTLVQTNTVEATDDPTSVDGPTVVKIPSLGEDEVRQAVWEAEANITVVSTALKSGDKILDKGEYEYACEFYGVEVKAEPTAEDFKFVPEGSVVVPEEQVIGSDEIAVKKESIAAPSAGTVKVEDNKVQLGVTVLKTSDLTAEKKEWGEVTLTADDVKVVDGKIVISVPVDSASGFMILQSGDAKVSDAAVTHEPWYTPTAED